MLIGSAQTNPLALLFRDVVLFVTWSLSHDHDFPLRGRFLMTMLFFDVASRHCVFAEFAPRTGADSEAESTQLSQVLWHS